MIYLTDENEIKNIILDLIETDILWLDTEVADYATKKPRLSLIQVLAYPENLDGSRTYMLDVLDKPDLINFFIKNIMINESIKKVFHNANYDLKLLGKTTAKNVFCTLEFSRQFPYHLLPVKSYSLKTLTEYLTNFKDLNKEEQGGDWGIRPLQKSQLEYAKMDCVYLAQIYNKLIELEDKIHQDFDNNSLDILSKRYKDIEEKWLLLDSEINYLKEKIKATMIDQGIKENDYFKLSYTQRTTIKSDLQELVKLINNNKINIDFPITLTKVIQEQLGDDLDSLKTNIETKIYYSLKECDPPS